MILIWSFCETKFDAEFTNRSEIALERKSSQMIKELLSTYLLLRLFQSQWIFLFFFLLEFSFLLHPLIGSILLQFCTKHMNTWLGTKFSSDLPNLEWFFPTWYKNHEQGILRSGTENSDRFLKIFSYATITILIGFDSPSFFFSRSRIIWRFRAWYIVRVILGLSIRAGIFGWFQ